LLREVVFFGGFAQDVYAPVIAHLEQLGYAEGRNLFVFAYDWRRSVFENAERLAAFVSEKVPDPAQRVDIVAHSMGGLISRVYALRFGGAPRIARLLSAGSPFLGSAKVFETLEGGWGTLNYLMGGLTAVRQTMLSFPSLFELMPRYTPCCIADKIGTSFDPTEAATWRALSWEGVDPDRMAALKVAAARAQELDALMRSPLPPQLEDVLIIGVDQRTPERVALLSSGKTTTLQVQTTWAGDGTVLRQSAALPGRTIHPTSFADHEKILHDKQVQQFLSLALLRGVPEAVRTVEIRPRSTIRTADGQLTQLVGVAVRTDRPAYRSRETGEARVHLRLGNQQPVAPSRVRLTFRASNGAQKEVVLHADPSASDPTNPFEQTLVGQFDAGTSGVGRLVAAVTVGTARPRLVNHPVAVLDR